MSHGDPARYGEFLDGLVPEISAASLAELEQAVQHWREAGWSDLAIGAVVATSFAEQLTTSMLRSVQYCRKAL